MTRTERLLVGVARVAGRSSARLHGLTGGTHGLASLTLAGARRAGRARGLLTAALAAGTGRVRRLRARLTTGRGGRRAHDRDRHHDRDGDRASRKEDRA
ncbi:hypothetical protein ACFY7C_06310 [Streptomyces sp. NPDC012769]|uniref:hypothetical protein n=1 Tax=Streptomyces sp. NPDC012769 TaxID=3364848 RepID=UPI0036B05998